MAIERPEFTDEEKIKNFDKLAEHYYNTNFGTVPKSDIDLLMFSFYLDHLIIECSDKDFVLDYNKASDYVISKTLGITQQKVKNLKVLKQLKYPIEYDWKKSFSSLVKNARYDEATKKIIISIPDPNLFLDLQNYIEEQGGYVEMQRNGKILQIRAEYFIEIALLGEEEKNQNNIIEKIKKDLKNNNKVQLEPKYLGKELIEVGVNITTIIANISGLFSPGNILASSLLSIFT